MYYLICPCIFIMLNICNYYSICGTLNFVGTPKELTKIVDSLKSKFKMKDPGKQFFFRGLQIEYFSNEILVYQSTCTKKVLKHFHMDKSHPLSYLMIVHLLEVKNDILCPKKNNEELLVQKYHITVLVVYQSCTTMSQYTIFHGKWSTKVKCATMMLACPHFASKGI